MKDFGVWREDVWQLWTQKEEKQMYTTKVIIFE
jgi:hypothetical protein